MSKVKPLKCIPRPTNEFDIDSQNSIARRRLKATGIVVVNTEINRLIGMAVALV
jgi:hypothetical protein